MSPSPRDILEEAGWSTSLARVFSPDGAPARRRRVAGRRAGRCEEARPRPHGAGGASGSSSGDRPEKSTPPQRLQETKPRKCGPLQGKSSESVCFCPSVEFYFTLVSLFQEISPRMAKMGRWASGCWEVFWLTNLLAGAQRSCPFDLHILCCSQPSPYPFSFSVFSGSFHWTH